MEDWLGIKHLMDFSLEDKKSWFILFLFENIL